MTQATKPTAAQALYPHLASGALPERTQRAPGLADSIWPGLSRATKAQEADERLWATILRKQRDDFRRRQREAKERGR
jgi:hypothetical protein